MKHFYIIAPLTLASLALLACGPEPESTTLKAEQALSGDAAQFVADVTLPDHVAVVANACLVSGKTWRFRNAGSTTWTDYSFCRTSGESFGAPNCVAIPGTTPPGGTVDIKVVVNTPPSPTCAARGHQSTWQIKNKAGAHVSGGVARLILTISPASGPDLRNAAYSTLNGYAQRGYGGQCTAYAYGRYLEKTGRSTLPGSGDAATWWAAVTDSTKKSQTPRANSVAVWGVGTVASSSHGHVAFVESTRTSSTTVYVTISEANWACFESSNWGGGFDGALKSEMTLSQLRTRLTGSSFLGFVFP